MSTQITPMYAGILGLGLAILGIRAILLGGKQGHSDDAALRHNKAMQAYENFTQYVPLALLLIWFLELQAASGLFLHTLCLLVLVGRLSHAFGVSPINEKPGFRVAGMGLTFVAIITVSVRLLFG